MTNIPTYQPTYLPTYLPTHYYTIVDSDYSNNISSSSFELFILSILHTYTYMYIIHILNFTYIPIRKQKYFTSLYVHVIRFTILFHFLTFDT